MNLNNSRHILKLATMIEKVALTNILAEISTRFKKEVAPTMPTRADYDGKYNEELQSNISPKTALGDIASSVRSVHEASRAQRDIEIINAGRKQLIKSCLGSVEWRVRKLERNITAMENTPQ